VFVVFVGLNVWAVELSFKFTVVITFIAMAILIFFFLAALSVFDFNKLALNIGIGADGAAVDCRRAADRSTRSAGTAC